jgi:hypothetical protein
VQDDRLCAPLCAQACQAQGERECIFTNAHSSHRAYIHPRIPSWHFSSWGCSASYACARAHSQPPHCWYLYLHERMFICPVLSFDVCLCSRPSTMTSRSSRSRPSCKHKRAQHACSTVVFFKILNLGSASRFSFPLFLFLFTCALFVKASRCVLSFSIVS